MTVGEAYTKNLVTDAEIDAAVKSYLDDPSVHTPTKIGSHLVDVPKAVYYHKNVVDLLDKGNATLAQKWMAVKAVILMAEMR